jgi:hypothetical protein
MPVLFWISCSACPVLDVAFCLSCSGFPLFVAFTYIDARAQKARSAQKTKSVKAHWQSANTRLKKELEHSSTGGFNL